jgi:hypothetical protein
MTNVLALERATDKNDGSSKTGATSPAWTPAAARSGPAFPCHGCAKPSEAVKRQIKEILAEFFFGQLVRTPVVVVGQLAGLRVRRPLEFLRNSPAVAYLRSFVDVVESSRIPFLEELPLFRRGIVMSATN